MEGGVKAEINGTPLPQRNPKNPIQNQNAGGQKVEDDGVPEKKPRFGGGQGAGGQGGNPGNLANRDNNRGRNRYRGGNRGGRPKQEGDNKGPGGDGILGAGGDNLGGVRDNNLGGGGRDNNLGGGGRDNNPGGGGGGRDHFGGGGRDNFGSRDNIGGGRRDRDRNDDRGRGMGGGGGGGMGRRGEDFMLANKIKQIQGPTHELTPIEAEETKFSGRNRLYVGNLTNDIKEDELRELFKPFGEISEVFLNAEKNFAFLKVDYHANAERAKRELDGFMRKNRALRVRFAPNATIIRVKNLTPYVSNELLFKAFEVFGPVERAVIVVDDRGKSTGEGIVEFARKAGAMAALRFCNDKCYFLTASLRPCFVEPFEINDDTDGLPDKSMNKKTQDFFKARQVGPRYAEPGSFEHEYGTRWKQLHELFKQKHDSLKRELELEEEKLEAQMEYARYEHETELLREQLRQREADRERQKMEWEMRERQRDEQRMREEEQIRRQQEDMQIRMNRQDEEMRRRQQENTLFMQAQQLNSLLDQQEMNQGGDINNSGGQMGPGGGGNMGNRNNFGGNMNRNFGAGDNLGGGGGNGNAGGGNTGNQEQGFMPFDIGLNDKPNQFDNANQGGNAGRSNQQRGGGGGGGGVNRPWNTDNRGAAANDFQNKRRRF